MRNIRGLIALVIAITLGFFAVNMLSGYLRKPAPSQPVQVEKEEEKAKNVLFSNIPDGMRVLSIKVNAVSGISGKLEKGDRVDVIATSRLPENIKGRVSRIILQGVEIYETASGSMEIAKRLVAQKKSWTVLLLLKTEDAVLLTTAAKESDITLMMRGKSGDLAQMDHDHDNARYIFTENQGNQKLVGRDAMLGGSIPGGMRAVSIEIQDTDGICGVIRAGDSVDVIVACKISKVASGSDITPGAKGTYTEYRMHSRLLLQNIKVLATQLGILPGGDLNLPVKIATLLVKPQDAVTLTCAMETSRKNIIKLVVRNPEDIEIPTTETVYMDEIMTQKKAYRLKVHVIRGVNTKIYSF